jgi:hypothetical protein
MPSAARVRLQVCRARRRNVRDCCLFVCRARRRNVRDCCLFVKEVDARLPLPPERDAGRMSQRRTDQQS